MFNVYAVAKYSLESKINFIKCYSIGIVFKYCLKIIYGHTVQSVILQT